MVDGSTKHKPSVCHNGFLNNWWKIEVRKIKYLKGSTWSAALKRRTMYQLNLLKEYNEALKSNENYFSEHRLILAFEAKTKWKKKGYQYDIGRVEGLEYVTKESGDSAYGGEERGGKRFMSNGKAWIIPVSSFAIKVRWYLIYGRVAPDNALKDDSSRVDDSWYYFDSHTHADWVSSESPLLEIDFTNERKVKFYAGTNKEVKAKSIAAGLDESKRSNENEGRRRSSTKNSKVDYAALDIGDDDWLIIRVLKVLQVLPLVHNAVQLRRVRVSVGESGARRRGCRVLRRRARRLLAGCF